MDKRKVAIILAFLVLISGIVATIHASNIRLYIKNLTTKSLNGLCFDEISFVALLFDVELAGKGRSGGWPT